MLLFSYFLNDTLRLQAYGADLQNESVVSQLGCITQGFSSTQLEASEFSLDYLEDIAGCGWNETQVMPWKQLCMQAIVTLFIH